MSTLEPYNQNFQSFLVPVPTGSNIFVATKPNLRLAYRAVSGTYQGCYPTTPNVITTILELRVDVDGNRPQQRISGDFFDYLTIYLYPGHVATSKQYRSSFIVESITSTQESYEMILTGQITNYDPKSKCGDNIEVHIPRTAAIDSSPPPATVKIFTNGLLTSTYVCNKISEYFRKINLEIDCFQGTVFPPTVNTLTNPHPSDLANEDMTVLLAFQRAGIEVSVDQDDILTDPDSNDPGDNWDEAELHDLMENHFSNFSNSLSWNNYGVVVPKFGEGNNYDPKYYGVMFECSHYQPGETNFRQGAAVAYTALMGRVKGTLYSTNDQKNRFFLETFIHEIGHTFNLLHTWERKTTNLITYNSNSFMNYPWNYKFNPRTGADESSFWTDFRWEFDDAELLFIRHANRKDAIFGGVDFSVDAMAAYVDSGREEEVPLSLEVHAKEIYDYAEQVDVEIAVTNISESLQSINSRLELEDGFVTVFIVQPDGKTIQHHPPLSRCMDSKMIILQPKQSIEENIRLSYGSAGSHFVNPGEYLIRVYYDFNGLQIASKICRLRISSPKSNNTEELAFLLFSPPAAKFLYYGGSELHPNVTTQLKEAADKFENTDFNATRHIHLALGRYQGRVFKKIVKKDGRTFVSARQPKLETAVTHLKAARKLSVNGTSPLTDVSYNKVSKLLTEAYLKQKNISEARLVLQDSLQYFQKRQAKKTVIEDYQKSIQELSTGS